MGGHIRSGEVKGMTGKWQSAIRRKADGFTLIELMIVIMIILILIGIAAGRYDRAVLHARETALRSDLQTMRTAIETYTLDKQAAPQSLQQLADEKYLRAIPVDPMTQSQEWQIETGDVMLSATQNGTGITDVHSTSTAVALDGTAYNSW
ncbi:MAG: prepilin-type N-terminal cleavage/methylation domain-containing protein [Acidobacteria bacterium]|nr:prepilin-type N-terminal cleavage/methylation domain-containing protein [Acidobacteriota bacterium]MBS1866944.1 prepilin-type N-terminal cleavage/methylation domain-containing protein [Acidobacteriota bacterium]